MELLVHFSPAPASISALRRQVADALAEALPLGDRDAVVLLTSELATNAISHAHPPFSLTVTVLDGTVRVEVTDCGEGVPVICHPQPTDTGGRGMLIVDQLADGWGVERRDGSKTVWFELRV